MKVLIVCVMICSALATWSWLRPREPVPDISALTQRVAELSASIREISAQASMLPVVLHWERVQNYVGLFNEVAFVAATDAKQKQSSHASWSARLVGPVLPVLTIAHGVQSLAPVELKKLTVRSGRAELSLHVLGSAP